MIFRAVLALLFALSVSNAAFAQVGAYDCDNPNVARAWEALPFQAAEGGGWQPLAPTNVSIFGHEVDRMEVEVDRIDGDRTRVRLATFSHPPDWDYRRLYALAGEIVGRTGRRATEDGDEGSAEFQIDLSDTRTLYLGWSGGFREGDLFFTVCEVITAVPQSPAA